ncbi:hypothetical protein [Acinetobacter sp. NyZ410]|uniref:hypothetical protein n=1 Tax=Acinetobacter sp. NyZ410 TaxID=2929509 RepID=UPI001FBAC61C|nr:hypothetical protein [Acinetobacter sp. NyZ410]UOH19507.1 hypothetical protein MTO68_04845 [Acinetobacter sp. NyZ410]
MSNEEANPELEFTKVRDNLVKTLDELYIDPDTSISVPELADSNIPLSDCDYIKDYLTRIKMIVKDEPSDSSIVSYLQALDEEIKDLKNLKNKILSTHNLQDYNKEMRKLKNHVFTAHDELLTFKNIQRKFRQISFDEISKSLAEVNTELHQFRRLRGLANNALTEKIYENAVSKYKTLEDNYRNNFYTAICATILISLIMFVIKKWLVSEIGEAEFWVLKASVLIIGVTLISYYLKQSSHYQRLSDQNYQTQLELQAYPSFMESIPTNEAAAIRKELALKYFGKEIDGSTHKDISNLISDQMKNTTAMIKATTDVLKHKIS